MNPSRQVLSRPALPPHVVPPQRPMEEHVFIENKAAHAGEEFRKQQAKEGSNPARARHQISAETRTAIRHEVLREVRDALDRASDFESFRDAMEESDPTLPGLTVSEIAAFTPEQVLEHKTAVDAVMSQGSSGLSTTGSPAPSRTGQQPLDHGSGPAPLSFESLKRMSVREYESRRAEIDAFLSRGGRAA